MSFRLSGEASVEYNTHSVRVGRDISSLVALVKKLRYYEKTAQWSGHTGNATESNFRVFVDFESIPRTSLHFCRPLWFTSRR